MASAFSFYPARIWEPVARLERSQPTMKSARKVRMLRNHGQVKKYYHDIEGYNGRLDAMQAGISDSSCAICQIGIINAGR